MIPIAVQQRVARRRAESAWYRGEEVTGPGSEGYGTKGKGKSKEGETGDQQEFKGSGKRSGKGEGK